VSLELLFSSLLWDVLDWVSIILQPVFVIGSMKILDRGGLELFLVSGAGAARPFVVWAR
jgi:hypothetical protein